jgi:hypothetical protein
MFIPIGYFAGFSLMILNKIKNFRDITLGQYSIIEKGGHLF